MPDAPTLASLRREITLMGELIEQNVDTALMALVDRNQEMADEVIRSDALVDEMENDIDRAGQALLQREQVAPQDFRFVVSCMKICVDLERMGDQAVEIARSVSFLIARQSILDSNAFAALIETTEQMVRDSVLCLMKGNAKLAWRICLTDDIVDVETQRLHDFLISVAQDQPEKTERAVHLLYVVRALERIADQATNIAEEVIFMLEGKIVRHHIDEYRRQLESQRRHRRAETIRKSSTTRRKAARKKKAAPAQAARKKEPARAKKKSAR